MKLWVSPLGIFFKSKAFYTSEVDWIVDCTYELTVRRPAASLNQILVDLPVI